MSEIKNIAIFCGSSNGTSDVYRLAAIDLATHLTQEKIGIVYGGASVGLMGFIADAAIAKKRTVIGVLPKLLSGKEIAHSGLSKLHLVSSMHDRKKLMYDLSDAFVALPGGFGTLDEFFEILTWSQLGMHQKPCAILNTNGYFDSLLTFLDKSVAEGFVKQANREMILVANSPTSLLEGLKKFVPISVPKWIDEQSI